MAFSSTISQIQKPPFSLGILKANIRDYTAASGDTTGTISEPSMSLIKHVIIGSGNLLQSSAAVITAGSAAITFVVPASTAGSVVIQDLTYTSVATDKSGNLISIAYTTGGTAGSEVVTVVANAISVQIQSGVSTATQVRAAVLASGPAAALVGVAISGTGSNAQTAPVSATFLTGGITGGASGSLILLGS